MPSPLRLWAATWIRDHLGDKITPTSSHVGTLAFLEGVPATV
jgi:hypothetical protein